MLIKAIGPDNARQIREIVRLFTEVYGDSFPIASVYDPSFWATHIQSRFVSFLIYIDDEVVGHVGLQPDRDQPNQVQLVYPALKLESKARAALVSRAVKYRIEHLAEKQCWRNLYLFISPEMTDLLELVTESLELTEVARLPGYIPTVSSDRSEVIVSQRFFSESAAENGISKLFVPASLKSIVSESYEALGLSEQFQVESNLGNANGSSKAVTGRGIEQHSYRSLGITHTFVTPSLLDSFISSNGDSNGTNEKVRYLFINMNDSATPSYCKFLEKEGYRFCGVVPAFRGRESIVYSNYVNADSDSNSLLQAAQL